MVYCYSHYFDFLVYNYHIWYGGMKYHEIFNMNVTLSIDCNTLKAVLVYIATLHGDCQSPYASSIGM